jgi:tRNA A-37 threonylcarbamoyl transferase component Bud32
VEPGLPERYAVIRKIASGGMAEVYLCRLRGEEGFEKKVAVKVVHPRLTENARFRDMFIREARIAASFSHQNLVQVFDFGKRGTSFYLAMEFVDGWNLAQVVAQMRLRSVPVPLPLWRYWVEGMLDGISYLHSRKVIHRDITPSNILLSRAGAVKITDFGIARGVRLGEGRAEAWEGKYSYMSPEQARGEDASVSSDLFSAGVIAAEFFLSGRLFDGEGREEILARLRDYDAGNLPLDRVPSAVSGILRKGLAKDREGRYPTAGSFAMAIHHAVPGTVSRTDLIAFWDLLFPGAEKGEEDTVVADAVPPAGESNMVREDREAYGVLGRRGFRIGAASAIVAVSVGGVMLWKGAGPSTREHSSVAANEISSAGPMMIPPGGNPWNPDAVADSAVDPGDPSPNGRRRGGGAPTRRARDPLPQPSGIRSAEETAPNRDGLFSAREKSVWIETEPAGVSVNTEDGTSLGSTPLQLDTAPLAGGTIVFRKEGYVARSVSANSLAQLSRFRIALERRTGTLEVVQAIPWANVYEGKQHLGVTPISLLELPEGEHRLRFVNEPLGVERVVTVTVSPGANPKLIVPLVGDR